MPLGLIAAGHAAAPAIARTLDAAAAARESVACALCGQAAFERLASIARYGMGLATVGGPGCGLVQTRPRLTAVAVAVDAFYRDASSTGSAFARRASVGCAACAAAARASPRCDGVAYEAIA